MATLLRDWSYRYPWLYQTIAKTTALVVGGDRRLRHLPLQGIEIQPHDRVLDLCCGRGEATRYLVQKSDQVTGLDASPKALRVAQQQVPQATYVEGWAQQIPLPAHSFDLVHTSLALHELEPDVRIQVIKEAHRVLKPNGILALIDFHQPTTPLMWPGLAAFLGLFETETAWALIRENLAAIIQAEGFMIQTHTLHAGGSLQVIQAHKG